MKTWTDEDIECLVREMIAEQEGRSWSKKHKRAVLKDLLERMGIGYE